ncbi:MAG: DUF4465 domain-containing protein [Alistipes sp.]|jgi:hypothetical protein|nr:DUF4465 domain-containing protein [Alistipes sp.]
MRKLFYLLCLLAFVSCDKGEESVAPEKIVESFEGVIDGEYAYGFHGENVGCEHFYNDEYNYWGGFALSKVYDRDATNGKYENQYAVYNTEAASGDNFLLYYYDSYSDPCDMVFIKQSALLHSVKLNLTTYVYASITDEAINDFARKFEDGDYLKVVFSALDKLEKPTGESVECYVVDYRDGKRFVADNWNEFSLGFTADRVRITIETSDVGEYGANTPLYIAIDDLVYSL